MRQKQAETKECFALADKNFKDLVEKSNDVIYILSEDGNFVYVSPSWKKFLGHELSDVVGHSFAEFVFKQDIPKCREFLQKVVNGDKVDKSVDYRVRHKDGSLKYHASTGSLYKDAGKYHFIGVARDITRRKEVELALVKSEKQYRLIFDKAPVGIFHFDSDGVILDCNENFVKIIGSSRNKLLGLNMLDLPDKKLVKSLRKCLDGDLAVYEGKYHSVTADKVTPVRVLFTPVMAKSGKSEGGIGIVEDITERYKAEKLLRISERKFRTYTEQAPLAIFIVDEKGRNLEVNKAACELTGYSKKELLQLTVSDFVASEYACMFERVKKKGFVEGDLIGIRKNNEKCWIALTAIKLSKNKYLGFCKDVTQRKKAEDRLQYHFDFEKVVSDIASYFAGLPSEKVDSGINHALETLGEFFEVGRSYLFSFSSNQELMSNTHEWCAKDVEPQIKNLQNIKVSSMPWWVKKIKNERSVNIYDIDDLPQEAKNEKEIFKSQDIKSLLCISMVKEGSILGFLGFDSVKSKKVWTQEHITLLKVAVELISSALSRHFAEEQIRRLTFQDSLTGLHNRLYLEGKMKRFNRKNNLPISLIMIDLNGLKLVNDTYGHLSGDRMLREAACILQDSCRDTDIVTRWGGDEFIILLPKTSESEAENICRRIRNKCRKTFIEDVPMSMALGIAVKNEASKDLRGLLTEAENDMYKNKLTEKRSDKSKLLKAMLKTLGEKSHETEEHTKRMEMFGVRLGEAIGLGESELSRLKLLISLHDIGKINIAGEILNKKRALNKSEWEIMKQHPETGYRIARATEEFSYVSEDILSHHERWDGLGYPRGVEGEKIPLLARITAIVDAYEVMSYGRPYKEAMSKKEIIKELEKCAGKQFDPNLVSIFVKLIED